ncbi:hypothetical protein RN001_008074 [Aquatica leii]|uniref:Neprilysin n=1 Tax=Aquatica leii TaxID=1421715 RepID=A0AAN7SP46_9COLE|nr:hypothetical protein RN001_008074 [Aquatica leii]
MFINRKYKLNFCISIIFFVEVLCVNSENASKHSRCIQENKQICTTPSCVYSAVTIMDRIDETIEPCDDFYKFACGNFVKKAVIPDDAPIVSSFTIIQEKVLQQLRIALDDLLATPEVKTFATVKKFYQTCLNTTAIDTNSNNVTLNILNKLGGWPALLKDGWNEIDFDWKKTMYNFREMGIPTHSLINIFPGVHTYNSSQYIINCDQARLGLDRQHLIKGFEDDFVTAYYKYLVDLAIILGADKATAEKDLKDSVNFEISLAEITLASEDRRNMSTLTNIMTLSTVQKKYPVIPWIEYLQNLANDPSVIITENEEIDIGVPKFLTDLNVLLQKTPKRVLSNYIMSQFVITIVPYLSTKIRTRKFEFSKAFHGTAEMKPRWKECLEQTTSGLKVATGALYVRNYFDDNDRKHATALVDSLRAEFLRILKNVEWMDVDTKQKAINKMLKMNARVGYPSEFLDDRKIEKYYSKLNFNSDEFLELTLQINKFHVDNSYKQLRKVLNTSDWRRFSSVTNVNAYYNFVDNGIQLPAGILQGVFFESNRPNYLNFGSMGFAIGHEITHGFDDMGRQYDEDGFLKDWWKDKTAKAFLSHAQCIINQYSNYTYPDLHLKLNGINTQGENIADNGGIKQAYLAYQNWIKNNGEEPQLPGLKYTPQQLFWISMANLWCVKERNEYLAQEVLTDDHPPSDFRVKGLISNSKYFSRDFNCPVGSPMNPAHKCSVW